MQDRYISLDPENAERTSAQNRAKLYQQRVTEAAGGEVGVLVGTQVGLTAATISYANLRAGGFRVFPYCYKKTPKYAAIAFAGVLGYSFGSTYVFTHLGDREQYSYLLGNRSAITRGEKSLN